MSGAPITDPVAKRVAMINGRFDLPPATLEAMATMRAAFDACARAVEQTATGVERDTGRLIATMDLLQQAKNVACDAVILPHARK